jgi:predicted phage terminase large subunit-like protein
MRNGREKPMSVDPRRQLLALKQERWRRQCRQSFIAFSVEALSSRDEVPALHHRLLCSELEALARGKFSRLMVLMPPGAGKTTYTSRLFPAWFCAFKPGANIIAASHTASLAEENSGFVQRVVRDNADTLGFTLLNDAKDLWHPSSGGGYLATGVGGTIRGFRADLAIIDDPIKSYDEAESLTLRDSTWAWFVSDLQSRLTPTGRIVLIATPLHMDDLMGRLLRVQADQWRVLRLPALAEVGDALGRAEGEPLWADDGYGYGAKLLELRDQHEREGRLRDWYGQYQGRPQPPEGNLFKPGDMPIVDMLPGTPFETIRAWDLAATAGGGDSTVGLKLIRCLNADHSDGLVIADVRRIRGGPEEVERLVLAVAEADGPMTKIALPQDPGQAGLSQIAHFTKLLMGRALISERMTGNKEVRARAAAAQCNVGRIAMLRAPWNAALVEELASFPTGLHDDQVDALSLAFNLMTPSTLSTWLRLL